MIFHKDAEMIQWGAVFSINCVKTIEYPYVKKKNELRPFTHNIAKTNSKLAQKLTQNKNINILYKR